MVSQEDLRKFARIEELGEIVYKFPSDPQSYHGTCINISGCGIFFTTDKRIESGKALEVKSAFLNSLTPAMVAYVEVIRCIESQPGTYEVGVEIKGIKEP